MAWDLGGDSMGVRGVPLDLDDMLLGDDAHVEGRRVTAKWAVPLEWSRERSSLDPHLSARAVAVAPYHSLLMALTFSS